RSELNRRRSELNRRTSELNRWGSELNEWRIGGPILEIKAPKVRFRRGVAHCVGVGSSVSFFRTKHMAGLFDYLRMAAWRMASSSLCRQRAPQLSVGPTCVDTRSIKEILRDLSSGEK